MTAAGAPTRRNALVTWLVPTICFALMPVLGGLLGTTAFRFAPNAAALAGTLITLGATIGMTKELNAAAGSDLKGWHILIPVYNLYFAAVLVPRAMTAKQEAGKGAPRSSVLYFLLFLYAFASDLNDLAA